jgi:hypothetical protein
MHTNVHFANVLNTSLLTHKTSFNASNHLFSSSTPHPFPSLHVSLSVAFSHTHAHNLSQVLARRAFVNLLSCQAEKIFARQRATADNETQDAGAKVEKTTSFLLTLICLSVYLSIYLTLNISVRLHASEYLSACTCI